MGTTGSSPAASSSSSACVGCGGVRLPSLVVVAVVAVAAAAAAVVVVPLLCVDIATSGNGTPVCSSAARFFATPQKIQKKNITFLFNHSINTIVIQINLQFSNNK